MQYIIDWLKGIAIFLIIAGIIVNLVPNAAYKRYINLFVSIVSIILFVKPVLGDSFTEKVLSQNILSDGIFSGNTDDTVYVKNTDFDIMTESVRMCIRDKLEAYLSESGYAVRDVFVELDCDSESKEFGKIIRLKAVYTKAQKEGISVSQVYIGDDDNESLEMTEKLKDYISSAYNLGKNQINVVYMG